MSWGKGEVDFPVNRRQLDEAGNWIGMGPSEGGIVDRSVPVLQVQDAGGALRAVLFGCACHNVTLGPQNLLVSADYAGFTREILERSYPTATAIFLSGCGADVNTHPRGGARQWVHVRQHGAALASEVDRVLKEETFLNVPARLRTTLLDVDLPLMTNLSREELVEKAEGAGWEALNPHFSRT